MEYASDAKWLSSRELTSQHPCIPPLLLCYYFAAFSVGLSIWGPAAFHTICCKLESRLLPLSTFGASISAVCPLQVALREKLARLWSLHCFIALFYFFLCLPVFFFFAPLPSLFLTPFHLFLSSWSLLYFFILPISPSSFSSFISSSCQFLSPYFHFFPFLLVFNFYLLSSLSFCSLTPSHEINIQNIWMCPKHILYNSLNEWAS